MQKCPRNCLGAGHWECLYQQCSRAEDRSYGQSEYEDPAFDGDSSTEDVSGHHLSLRGTDLFGDLEAADSVSASPGSHFSTQSSSGSTDNRSPGLYFCHMGDGSVFPSSWSSEEMPVSLSLSNTVECCPVTRVAAAAGGAESLMDAQEAEGREAEGRSFPISVRSKSTSQRHSWEVPLSPTESGRRLSLDNTAVDSDGVREDLPQSSHLNQSSVSPECSSESLEEPNGEAGKDLYLRSEIPASEQSRAMCVLLETSLQAARAAGEEQDLDENMRTEEGQSHMLMVQSVLQELKQYHGALLRSLSREGKEASGDVTWYEFLSNENDGEEDRAEKVECNNKKVRHTFSSLKSRMAGSFIKDKVGGSQGKSREKEKGREKDSKEKETKEKKESKEKQLTNGHQLVPGTFSSCATCSLCSKALQRKHRLQCQNCAVNVHRNCRSLLAECSSQNRFDESPSWSKGKGQSRVQQYHALKESTANGLSSSPRGPGMTIIPRGQGQSSQPIATGSTNSGSIPGEMEETDGAKLKLLTDESVFQTSSAAESIILEDAHYATLRADLESDAQDFEAESWSLAVDPQYFKNLSKEAVKRQDVIYELIQTEIHHVRTLKIMQWVYARKMREALQMDERKVERIFPRLETLLEVHRHFLSRLKDQRRESLESDVGRNYAIQRIGDVVASQFSGEMGEKMKESYGDFCSRHNEAVSYYKDHVQNNKKFQSLMRKISNLSIVRRLGVPECILLVTQRITKYPVLMERILQNTDAGTEEQKQLTEALAQIRDVITQVDAHVNDYEKATRLKDIAGKIEPKSVGKIKDGRVLTKENLTQGGRRLLHEGTVNWKAASGRLKDILAVLLSDVLLLLQEKDQKYTFSTVVGFTAVDQYGGGYLCHHSEGASHLLLSTLQDNKPSVISLQKLIVREVAHEEKAMFLICASAKEPEMYEIHTGSKEERNLWMAMIRQAVENCPHLEEGSFAEQEDERVSRLQEFQEQLSLKDSQVMQSLTEKLQIYAHLAETTTGMECAGSHAHLLLQGNSSDFQQGEHLLKEAIVEVESLQDLLLSGRRDAFSLLEFSPSLGGSPQRADTFGSYDNLPTGHNKNGCVRKMAADGECQAREGSQRAQSDPQLTGNSNGEQPYIRSFLHPQPDEAPPVGSSYSFPETEFLDRVLMLSQRLHSLQGILSLQDSQLGLLGSSLVGHEQPGRPVEPEKELAELRRLQSQHQQEQARRERKQQREQREAEECAAQLRRREDDCHRLEERLAQESRELKRQKEKYQQDLERLHESFAAVERERLELQKKQALGDSAGPQSSSESLQDPLHISSFNGDVSEVRMSDPVLAGDHPERQEVLPRRDSSSTLKTEVPIQLLSTTNELHKQGGVQQQIPTKLAALSKGKEKGKGKGSQRTDSSVSLDMKQMLTLKQSGKEDGSLKAKVSVSPQQPPHTDPAVLPDLGAMPRPSGPNAQRGSVHHAVAGQAATEDVIFF